MIFPGRARVDSVADGLKGFSPGDAPSPWVIHRQGGAAAGGYRTDQASADGSYSRTSVLTAIPNFVSPPKARRCPFHSTMENLQRSFGSGAAFLHPASTWSRSRTSV